MLKRYIAFLWEHMEQRGGWDDVLCADGRVARSFDTVEEAETALTVEPRDGAKHYVFCWDIVDLQTGQSVKHGTFQPDRTGS